MSNRLESLSGKRPGSGGAASDAAGSSAGSAAGSATSGGARPAKTLLRFKPKANVARRSQEDRAVKQEPVADHAALATRSRGGARGRGAGRGGARGGRQYAGTHIVSSGPLALGSVLIGGGVNGSKTGLTQDRVYNLQSPTPEFMQNLKLKELSLGGGGHSGGGSAGGGSAGGGSSGTPDAFSDDEFDPTRININEEYRFADEETELFPVRPGRDAPRDEAERPAAAEAAEESATASGLPTPLEGTLSEQLEAVRRRKHELEAKIAEPSNTLDLEEEAKYRGDFGSMARVLRGEGYTVMHLPKVLPRYEASAEAEATAAAAAKEEAAEAAAAAEGAAEDSASPEAKASAAETTSPTIKTEEPALPGMDAHAAAALLAGPYALAGQIGHVNIHRSGRVTINLGNDNVLEVAKGTAVDFLQEVVVLEGGEVARATRLGGVDEKMIATPLL